MTDRPGEPRPTVTLRPYQAAAIQAARAMVASKRANGEAGRALIVLPTGCGKTQTAISLLSAALDRAPEARVLWIAHRRELLTQPIAAMARVEATRDLARRCGMVQGGRDQADRQIVMASVATLAGKACARLRRVLAHGPPQIVVIDEAHHSTSSQYRAVIATIEAASPGAAWIGLTATPERTDGVGLSGLWGPDAALTYGISDAIQDGYLCPPRFVDAQLELDDDLKAELDRLDAAGDTEAMGDLLISAGVVPATVEAMNAHLGRSAQTGEKVPSLVFCANVKQAQKTAAALSAAGWRAELLTGQTKDSTRALMVEDFHAGYLDVIVNVAVLTEGTDIPRVGGIVAARPFSSKPLWLQSVGRGLRLYDGKDECIVVDIGGAHKEHHGILGVAVIGEADAEDDGKRLKLPGITYVLMPGQVIVIGGQTFRGVPADAEGGSIFVRALPVVRAKARGTMPAGADRGLRVVPIAVGREEEPAAEGVKPTIRWEPIADHEQALGASVDDDAQLPVSGRELSRKAGPGARSDLTRYRKALDVAWVIAKIGDREVRVVGLSSISRETPRFGALWVIEHGMADGEQGYLLGARFVGRNSPKLWSEPGDMLRPITGSPVPWATVDALASDYVRQAARDAAADEPWRAEVPGPKQVERAVRAGVPYSVARGAQTAGWLHDLVTRSVAERDPVGPQVIADWIAQVGA